MRGTERPTVPATPSPPTPGELRQHIDEVRAELGATVEELAHRADVPARVKERRDEVVEQVKVQAAHARDVVAEKAPQVTAAARQRPALIACVVAVLVALLVLRRRRAGSRR